MQNQSAKQIAVKQLRSMLNSGATVYTIVTHVSSSGMSRRIKLICRNGSRVVNISYWAAAVLGWKLHADTNAVVVRGCGMDMGFHTVDALSQQISRKLEHAWL